MRKNIVLLIISIIIIIAGIVLIFVYNLKHNSNLSNPVNHFDWQPFSDNINDVKFQYPKGYKYASHSDSKGYPKNTITSYAYFFPPSNKVVGADFEYIITNYRNVNPFIKFYTDWNHTYTNGNYYYHIVNNGNITVNERSYIYLDEKYPNIPNNKVTLNIISKDYVFVSNKTGKVIFFKFDNINKNFIKSILNTLNF